VFFAVVVIAHEIRPAAFRGTPVWVAVEVLKTLFVSNPSAGELPVIFMGSSGGVSDCAKKLAETAVYLLREKRGRYACYQDDFPYLTQAELQLRLAGICSSKDEAAGLREFFSLVDGTRIAIQTKTEQGSAVYYTKDPSQSLFCSMKRSKGMALIFVIATVAPIVAWIVLRNQKQKEA